MKNLHIGLLICGLAMQMFLRSLGVHRPGIMMYWFGKETRRQPDRVDRQLRLRDRHVDRCTATHCRVCACVPAHRGWESLAAKASTPGTGLERFAALVLSPPYHHALPTFFSTNPEVIAIAAQLLVLRRSYQLSDGIQNVSVGILRGASGREDHHADRLRILQNADTCRWATCSASRSAGLTGFFLGFSFGLSARP